MVHKNPEEDAQQKFYAYQLLAQQQKALGEQILAMAQGIEDCLGTEDLLKEMEASGKDVIVSVGKDCFMEAELKGRKVLVDLGAGVLAKKPLAEARKIIETRRQSLEKNVNELNLRLERIASETARLEPEIQKLLEGKK